MNPRYWILKGKKVIPTNDLLEWARFFENGDRVVEQTTLVEGVGVSTVFLGIDHFYRLNNPKPLIFETRVFGGPMNGEIDRYGTYTGAEAGHKKMVEKVKEALGADDSQSQNK